MELQGSADVRDQVRVRAGLGDLPVRAEQWRQVRSRVEEQLEEFARRHGGSHCKGCGAPIVWGQTESGKPMSVDPVARPMGNVIRVPQGKRMVLQVVPKSALPVVGRPAYQTHFASCPAADQLRRRRAVRERRPSSGVRCSAPGCTQRTPLDPVVVEEGFSTHPTCGPDEQPRRNS